VVFEDEEAKRVNCGAQRGDLLKDVNAVLFAVNHATNAAHLTLKATQAIHQHLAVFGVTVSRVSIHTLGGYPIRFRCYDSVPMETAVVTRPFAHQSEAEFARILDFYGVRWQYEATTFPMSHRQDGRVASSFAPDFYLPDLDLWVELTTIRQALMRQKRKKLLRFSTLYPQIRIKLLGATDIRRMMWKYGLSDREVVGAAGSMTPPRRRRALQGEVAA
jgi:hypoxanthine phosphoribosyltransferase